MRMRMRVSIYSTSSIPRHRHIYICVNWHPFPSTADELDHHIRHPTPGTRGPFPAGANQVALADSDSVAKQYPRPAGTRVCLQASPAREHPKGWRTEDPDCMVAETTAEGGSLSTDWRHHPLQ